VVSENFVWLWDLRIVKELHRQFFLLFDVVDPFQRLPIYSSGRLMEERQRLRAVDTVCRLKMKGFSKISL
jgi:hypothetical protein